MWIKVAAVFLMLMASACKYDAYSELTCASSSECPSGTECRSGFCASTNDVVPVEDMGDDTPDTSVFRIEVGPTLALNVGDTGQLEAQAFNRASEPLTVLFAWSSADESVATVSPSGEVTALGPGNTTITVSAEGIEAQATVGVDNPPVAIEVQPEAAVVGVGTSVSLSAEVTDINGGVLSVPVTWSSSDEAVATVSPAGVVAGVSEGLVTITATSGELSGTAEIDVQLLEPNALVLEAFNSSLAPIDIQDIAIRNSAIVVIEANLFYRDNGVELEFPNEPVAFALDSTTFGVLGNPGGQTASFTADADSEGVATITASYGELEETLSIEVYTPVPDTLTITPTDPPAFIGAEVVFTADVIAQDGLPLVTDVNWTSDNSSLATILEEDLGATAVARTLSPGAVTIRATAGSLTEETTLTIAGFAAGSISLGEEHTCALSLAGFAYCWGEGADGRLGDDQTSDRDLPSRVDGNRVFGSIHAGDRHTCALTSDGAVFCWGAGGRLGTGNSSGAEVPTPIAGTRVFQEITTGKDHTCGFTDMDELYCWGSGGSGQLGDGQAANSNALVLVPKPAGALGWLNVAAGHTHTCALDTAGKAYCWGTNDQGQLGNGTNDPSNSPVLVDVSGVNNAAFVWIGAGEKFTCARTMNGELYCWGTNAVGQLGLGAAQPNFDTPTQVPGLLFQEVSIGSSHACGLSGGDTYCWGDSGSGRIGAAMNQNVPTQVVGATFTSVKAGGEHTCGLLSTNSVECFGENQRGQLGIDNTDDQSSPALVWP